MPPLKPTKKRRNGADILLLNRIRIRSKSTSFRQISRALQPSPALLASPVLTSSTTTAIDPTARDPRQLKSSSGDNGKPKIEQQQQTTGVEDEEDEWAGCVFEGDDSPPVTPPSKSPSPSPLGVHPTPVDDVVLVTQPVEDAIEEKEGANDDAEEDVGEDKGKSGDGAKDGEP